MKKIFSTLLITLLLALSACTANPNSPAGPDSAQAVTQVADIVSQELTAAVPTMTEATVTTTSSAVELNTTYENAVSIEMQLLLGTFQLEKTDQAVTKEQASFLLPLWKSLKTLSQSLMPTRGMDQGQTNAKPQPPSVDTETQAQIKALGKQIQAVMTPEQLQAIAKMKITQKTTMTIMQEQGITPGGPQGVPPAGGPGKNGQPPADGQQPGAGKMFTPQTGGAGFLPTELVEALIQLLQSKAG